MRMLSPLLVAAAALLPIPVGIGPRYQPAPGAHGPCARAPLEGGPRVHVELFARRRVIVVPAAIGLRGPRLQFGRARGARCRGRLWTVDPSGVVRFEGTASLGDLFRSWGEPLRPARLLSFRGQVRLYRNGVRVTGDPRGLALRNRDELVLELGAYVRPHRAYRFPH